MDLSKLTDNNLKSEASKKLNSPINWVEITKKFNGITGSLKDIPGHVENSQPAGGTIVSAVTISSWAFIVTFSKKLAPDWIPTSQWVISDGSITTAPIDYTLNDEYSIELSTEDPIGTGATIAPVSINVVEFEDGSHLASTDAVLIS